MITTTFVVAIIIIVNHYYLSFTNQLFFFFHMKYVLNKFIIFGIYNPKVKYHTTKQ